MAPRHSNSLNGHPPWCSSCSTPPPPAPAAQAGSPKNLHHPVVRPSQAGLFLSSPPPWCTTLDRNRAQRFVQHAAGRESRSFRDALMSRRGRSLASLSYSSITVVPQTPFGDPPCRHSVSRTGSNRTRGEVVTYTWSNELLMVLISLMVDPSSVEGGGLAELISGT